MSLVNERKRFRLRELAGEMEHMKRRLRRQSSKIRGPPSSEWMSNAIDNLNAARSAVDKAIAELSE